MPAMKWIERIAHVIGCLIFAVFAWLQWNDADIGTYVDPSLWDVFAWIACYGLVAVGFGCAAYGCRTLPVLYVAGALVLFFLVRSTPGMFENLTGPEPFTLTGSAMSPDDPRVELSREFLGAAIALVGLVYLFWRASRPQAETSSERREA